MAIAKKHHRLTRQLLALLWVFSATWLPIKADDPALTLEATIWQVPFDALTTNVKLPAGSSWQFILGADHKLQVILVTPLGSSKTTLTASWAFSNSTLSLDWPGQPPSERALIANDGSTVTWQKRNGETEKWTRLGGAPATQETAAPGSPLLPTSNSALSVQAQASTKAHDPSIYAYPENEDHRQPPSQVTALVPDQYRPRFIQNWYAPNQISSMPAMYEKAFEDLFGVIADEKLNQLQQSGVTMRMSGREQDSENAKARGVAKQEARTVLPFPDGYVDEIINQGGPSPVVVDHLPYQFQEPFIQAWRGIARPDPGTPDFLEYEKAHEALKEMFYNLVFEKFREGSLKLSDVQRRDVKSSLQQIADNSALKLMPSPVGYEAARLKYVQIINQEKLAEVNRRADEQKRIDEQEQTISFWSVCVAIVLLIELAALFLWLIYACFIGNHPHLLSDDKGKRYCPAMRAIKEAKLARHKWRFPVSDPKANRRPSNVDEIERLVVLRDKGVLTQAEFESQKSKILSS